MVEEQTPVSKQRLVGLKGSRIFFSPFAVLLIFALACYFTISKHYVAGVIAFAALICLELFLCSDLSVISLPLLLVCVFVTNCYDSYDTFIKFVVAAPLVVAAVLYNIIAYREKPRIGRTLFGWIAVSIALLLGGFGYITAKNYFSGNSLFYTLGLGVGMLLFYLLVRSRFSALDIYGVFRKIALVMYLVGLLASLNVVVYYLPVFLEDYPLSEAIRLFSASNNLSTFLMFAMPYPVWYALKQNPFHILSLLLFYLSICATGSRAGLLLGTIEFVICIGFWAFYSGRIVRFMAGMVCSIGALLLIIILVDIDSILPGFNFVTRGEMRSQAIPVAIRAFLDHPIFGVGMKHDLLNGIYHPKQGAMAWFHMYVPQIVASMGCVGIFAYGLQLILRMTLILRRENTPLRLTLGISYIGVLLMSQLNPGEFCPIPYGMMIAVIFALLEQLTDTERLAKSLAPDWEKGIF